MATAASRGALLHAKVYVATWQANGTGRETTTLVWGSANASVSGFGRNAETLSSRRLNHGEARQVRAWLDEPGTGLSLAIGRSALSLPAVEVLGAGEQDFDSWLQAGRLCHRYDSDQRFGRVSVKLKRRPPDAFLRVVRSLGGSSGESEELVLQLPYVEPVRRNRKASGRWKELLFLETWLGHWTPPQFVSRVATAQKAEPGRQSLLRRVRRGRPETQTRGALRRLQKLASKLNGKKYKRSDYFEVVGSRLDAAHYERQFRRSIDLQRKMAASPGFQKRFEHGYVFPPVPPLRGIEDLRVDSDRFGFESFGETVADSLLRQCRKGKVKNLVAQAMVSVFGKEVIDELTPGLLLKLFRSQDFVEVWRAFLSELGDLSVADDRR